MRRRSTPVVPLLASGGLVFLVALATLLSPSLQQVEGLRTLKRVLMPGVPAIETFDPLRRLLTYPGKMKVRCPVQTDRVAVLLVIGQSNAANHAALKTTTRLPAAVSNYFDGRCYRAASPLLGASGVDGEFVTLLADELVARGLYDKVVIVSSAIGGSKIERWQKGGDLNTMLMSVLARLGQRYDVTQVIWFQGESDFPETSLASYLSSWGSVVESLDEARVSAKIFTAIATRCAPGWTADNSVAKAQRASIDGKRVFLGADIDRELTADDRQPDRCHLSESGQRKTAGLYARAIAGTFPAR